MYSKNLVIICCIYSCVPKNFFCIIDEKNKKLLVKKLIRHFWSEMKI